MGVHDGHQGWLDWSSGICDGWHYRFPPFAISIPVNCCSVSRVVRCHRVTWAAAVSTAVVVLADDVPVGGHQSVTVKPMDRQSDGRSAQTGPRSSTRVKSRPAVCQPRCVENSVVGYCLQRVATVPPSSTRLDSLLAAQLPYRSRRYYHRIQTAIVSVHAASGIWRHRQSQLCRGDEHSQLGMYSPSGGREAKYRCCCSGALCARAVSCARWNGQQSRPITMHRN